MKTFGKQKRFCALLLGIVLLLACPAGVSASPLAPKTGKHAAGIQQTTEAPADGFAGDTQKAEYTYLLGDVNGDGTVSVRDALMIQNYKALLGALTDLQKLSADIDMDKSLTITDILYIQKYLAGMQVDYPVGTVCTADEIPEQPFDPPTSPTQVPTAEPTDTPSSGGTEAPTDWPEYPTEPTTSPVTDPTAAPTDLTEPAAPTEPEETIPIYLRDGTCGLSENGCRLWVYSPEYQKVCELVLQVAGPYYKAGVPASWDTLAFYRTTGEIDREAFRPDLPESQLLNVWDNLPPRGEYDCFAVTNESAGSWEAYDPGGRRTIYFDTGGCNWERVYIYGWAFGLDRTFIPMEQVSDHVYRFTFPLEPIPGEDGFVFLDRNKWDGCNQTREVAVEQGKNYYTRLEKQDGKWLGVWEVWPGE